jgi:hypothetical protein
MSVFSFNVINYNIDAKIIVGNYLVPILSFQTENVTEEIMYDN